MTEQIVSFEDEKPVLDVLYQDEHIVAVNKPSGLFVHKSFMDRHERYFALQLVRDMVGQYVYPLHRLDRPTSGVLLFALNQDMARAMGELFTNHDINKTYFAITRGHLLGEHYVDHPLKEKLDKLGDKFVNEEKEAQSAQTSLIGIDTATLPIPVGKYDTVRYSLVKLMPKTGRRHQLRRHLSHLRYPIIGDINYGDNKQNPFFAQHFDVKRLMLHAKQVQFVHPVTKKQVTIDAPYDAQWQEIFKQLDWQKHCFKKEKVSNS